MKIVNQFNPKQLKLRDRYMKNIEIGQNIVVFSVYHVFNYFSWNSYNHKKYENRAIGRIFFFLTCINITL